MGQWFFKGGSCNSQHVIRDTFESPRDALYPVCRSNLVLPVPFPANFLFLEKLLSNSLSFEQSPTHGWTHDPQNKSSLGAHDKSTVIIGKISWPWWVSARCLLCLLSALFAARNNLRALFGGRYISPLLIAIHLTWSQHLSFSILHSCSRQGQAADLGTFQGRQIKCACGIAIHRLAEPAEQELEWTVTRTVHAAIRFQATANRLLEVSSTHLPQDSAWNGTNSPCPLTELYAVATWRIRRSVKQASVVHGSDVYRRTPNWIYIRRLRGYESRHLGSDVCTSSDTRHVCAFTSTQSYSSRPQRYRQIISQDTNDSAKNDKH